MGLLDSILSAVSGGQKRSGPGEANPLLGVLSGLLAQSGGLQGLANKFSQSQGDAFSSWGWLGRKPAPDFQQSNSTSAWFRPSSCTCGENGSGPGSSFAIPG
jgi:hypothetical protein